MRQEGIFFNTKRLLYVAKCVSFILLIGCSSLSVVPEIGDGIDDNLRVGGKVVFDGNKEYLPRMIVDSGDSEGLGSGLIFEYSYDVAHDTRDLSPFAYLALLPVIALGYPTGHDIVNVVGKLRVIRGGEVLKSYSAASEIKVRLTHWTSSNMSKMRADGLRAVKNSIESQMFQDRDFFVKQEAVL